MSFYNFVLFTACSIILAKQCFWIVSASRDTPYRKNIIRALSSNSNNNIRNPLMNTENTKYGNSASLIDNISKQNILHQSDSEDDLNFTGKQFILDNKPILQTRPPSIDDCIDFTQRLKQFEFVADGFRLKNNIYFLHEYGEPHLHKFSDDYLPQLLGFPSSLDDSDYQQDDLITPPLDIDISSEESIDKPSYLDENKKPCKLIFNINMAKSK